MSEKIVKGAGIPYTILRIAPISVTNLVELPNVIPYRVNQRVEFLHVHDAITAIFNAIRNPDAKFKVLNIAGGASWQMTGAEYIKKFYDALGVEVKPAFSKEYTALDWYDTTKSRFLDYQRTTFNEFIESLRALGEQLGLR